MASKGKNRKQNIVISGDGNDPQIFSNVTITVPMSIVNTQEYNDLKSENSSLRLEIITLKGNSDRLRRGVVSQVRWKSDRSPKIITHISEQ